MKRLFFVLVIISLQFAAAGCSSFFLSGRHQFPLSDTSISYTGRIDFSFPGRTRLSGAGSYFQFQFKGSECELIMEDQNLYGTNSNYIAIELDGKYRNRIKIHKDKTEYKVVSDLKDTVHTLLVCKATESQNGYIDLTGIECEEILPSKNFCDKRIEFIGNSITCGMGLEMNEIPCDSGMWFDQHNAYFAYGPVISRKLGADWLLSSVSGIGTTRNWNSKRPTMPQVYDNLFLDTDSTLLWNKEIFKPDLVSICLGTNDFSDGDGTYDREPLDSAMYVNDYIQFLKHIRNKNSSATICCLTSPTLSGKKSTRLQSYLKEIVKKAKEDGDDKIHLYAFQRAYNNGCTGHPDRKEHEMIADELLPFYRKIMNWQ